MWCFFLFLFLSRARVNALLVCTRPPAADGGATLIRARGRAASFSHFFFFLVCFLLCVPSLSLFSLLPCISFSVALLPFFFTLFVSFWWLGYVLFVSAFLPSWNMGRGQQLLCFCIGASETRTVLVPAVHSAIFGFVLRVYVIRRCSCSCCLVALVVPNLVFLALKYIGYLCVSPAIHCSHNTGTSVSSSRGFFFFLVLGKFLRR